MEDHRNVEPTRSVGVKRSINRTSNTGMSAGMDAIPARNASGISGLWNLTLGDIRGEAGAIALLIPLLLAATFWNGFPLIYYDTGAYVFEGLGGHFNGGALARLSLFPALCRARSEPLFAAVIQAAATAFVVTQCARAEIPRLRMATLGSRWRQSCGRDRPSLVCGPDRARLLYGACRSRDLLLAFRGIVSARARNRSRRDRRFRCGGASVTPPSRRVSRHSDCRDAGGGRDWRTGGRSRECWDPRSFVFLGLALIVGANFQFTRQFSVSGQGASFVFCAHAPGRHRHAPPRRHLSKVRLQTLCLSGIRCRPPLTAGCGRPTAPFSPWSFHGYCGPNPSASSGTRSFAIHLCSSKPRFGDAATQFARFRTGDQIEPQEWVLYPVLARYLPGQMRAYLAARQQRGEIDSASWDLCTSSWALCRSLVSCCFSGSRSQDDRDRRIVLPGFVLAALVGNAIICGVLSGPHDRYHPA